MSQFILAKMEHPIEPIEGICLRTVLPSEDFFAPITARYSCPSGHCRLVVDPSGSADSLVNDVWDTRVCDDQAEIPPLVRLMRRLVETKSEFVCWYGNDYENLPIVRSWPEVIRCVREQTAAQPVELYLHFQPSP